MLIILGSRFDDNASAFLKAFSGTDVVLLGAEDLSRLGWRYAPGESSRSTIVAGQQVIPARDIAGILTLRAGIDPRELLQVHPKDRDYMAAEMTAFLLAWLASLSCPVLNRPQAPTLAGPDWRAEQWLWAARRAGFQTETIRYTAQFVADEKPEVEKAEVSKPKIARNARHDSVTIIGDRVLGARDIVLRQKAKKLAYLAGVDYLRVEASVVSRGHLLRGVNLWPDASQNGVIRALADYFGISLQAVAGKNTAARWVA